MRLIQMCPPFEIEQDAFTLKHSAHPMEGLSLPKTRLEGPWALHVFETPFRKAQWLLRMSGSYIRHGALVTALRNVVQLARPTSL